MAKKKSSTGFSLKDHLFNRERVEYLSNLFASAEVHFDAQGFVSETLHGFQTLELKQRIVKIATTLESYLHDDFMQAAQQILDALPPPLDPTRGDDDFGDFIFAPLGVYVVRNGAEKRHLRLSLMTLKQLTMRFSMEDAIRHFINLYPDETFQELGKWAVDRNYHVRRLVSEGTRPLLPWSGRLSLPVERPLPLLDMLFSDPTRYVTRSVANHLNDIAKSHPELVIETLVRWQATGKQGEDEMRWMTRHALRTLVKQAHLPAIKHLGFHANPKIEVTQFALAQAETRPGQELEFSFEVTALQDTQLLLDYVINFVKADGKTAPKVFKLKQVQLRSGQPLKIVKRHPLRANATTFSLYPGTHQLKLQINGRVFGELSFELLPAV